MIIIQEEEMVVRELTEKDAFLLVNWLSNPIILEYYEGRDRPHDKHYNKITGEFNEEDKKN